jgi:meiotic recombination protein SPO11
MCWAIRSISRPPLTDSPKVSRRSSINTAHVRKAAITTRVLQLIHEVVSKGIHITKRDLFYTDVKLFIDQTDSDGVLDDIACMVGCTRTSLHVIASDKVCSLVPVSFS